MEKVRGHVGRLRDHKVQIRRDQARSPPGEDRGLEGIGLLSGHRASEVRDWTCVAGRRAIFLVGTTSMTTIGLLSRLDVAMASRISSSG
jgi:hypothetical protein